MKVELVDKTKLKPDRAQPRKTFTGIAELVASIQEKGIIVPLIITPDYRILDGERRWRASNKIKGFTKLPCLLMEKEDYEKADKRLEAQIIINESRTNYNIIEKAEAYQKYINAGHSQKELARMLGKHHSIVTETLILLASPPATQKKLKENDSNWTWHREVEKATSIPRKQKDRIHQRIFDGAFFNREDLKEALEFAKEHPVEREKIIEAKDTTERGLVMVGAERPVPTEYKPRKKASQEDIERMRFTEMVQALNTINNNRTLWAMSDAIDIVKKLATKEQKKNVIRSIETIVRVWSGTLKKLK